MPLNCDNNYQLIVSSFCTDELCRTVSVKHKDTYPFFIYIHTMTLRHLQYTDRNKHVKMIFNGRHKHTLDRVITQLFNT